MKGKMGSTVKETTARLQMMFALNEHERLLLSFSSIVDDVMMKRKMRTQCLSKTFTPHEDINRDRETRKRHKQKEDHKKRVRQERHESFVIFISRLGNHHSSCDHLLCLSSIVIVRLFLRE
jgi:hypothetical protein